MWQWLRKLFGFSSQVVEDVFTASVGGIPRRFDPLEVWRKLEQIGGVHWLDIVEPLRVGVPANMPAEAIENLHKARQHSIETIGSWVRFAFGLTPFSEGGPTDSGCVNLLSELLRFVNGMADAYRPFSICRERDAPSPSTAPEPQKV